MRAFHFWGCLAALSSIFFSASAAFLSTSPTSLALASLDFQFRFLHRQISRNQPVNVCPLPRVHWSFYE